MTEFKASDFTGEGVAGGRGTGTRIADAARGIAIDDQAVYVAMAGDGCILGVAK